jgi:hypothetical protein
MKKNQMPLFFFQCLARPLLPHSLFIMARIYTFTSGASIRSNCHNFDDLGIMCKDEEIDLIRIE